MEALRGTDTPRQERSPLSPPSPVGRISTLFRLALLAASLIGYSCSGSNSGRLSEENAGDGNAAADVSDAGADAQARDVSHAVIDASTDGGSATDAADASDACDFGDGKVGADFDAGDAGDGKGNPGPHCRFGDGKGGAEPDAR